MYSVHHHSGENLAFNSFSRRVQKSEFFFEVQFTRQTKVCVKHMHGNKTTSLGKTFRLYIYKILFLSKPPPASPCLSPSWRLSVSEGIFVMLLCLIQSRFEFLSGANILGHDQQLHVRTRLCVCSGSTHTHTHVGNSRAEIFFKRAVWDDVKRGSTVTMV